MLCRGAAANTSFWQSSVFSMRDSGSCRGIFPQANQVTIEAARSEKKSSSTGAIVGGVVGGIAGAVIILAAALYITIRRRRHMLQNPLNARPNPFDFKTVSTEHKVHKALSPWNCAEVDGVSLDLAVSPDVQLMCGLYICPSASRWLRHVQICC